MPACDRQAEMMLCQARTIIGLISLLLCLCPLSEANVEIGTEVATTDKALQGAQTGTFGSMPSESSLFSGLNYHEDFVEEITVKQHDSWSHKSRGTLPSVLSMQAPPQVLVITVDGSLHSVDLATGLLNWSKPFGPIISGTPQDEVRALKPSIILNFSCMLYISSSPTPLSALIPSKRQQLQTTIRFLFPMLQQGESMSHSLGPHSKRCLIAFRTLLEALLL